MLLRGGATLNTGVQLSRLACAAAYGHDGAAAAAAAAANATGTAAANWV